MSEQVRRERAQPLAQARLPNGLEVAYQSRAELKHFYEDIFEKEIYVRHGLPLPDDACVFDVGANIGLFTLFVQTRWPGSRVYAFEPAPPLFTILRHNAGRYAPRSQLFPCGVSNTAGSADFTFYPNSSGMSSFYAAAAEEREVLHAVLRNEAREGVAGARAMLEHVDDYLAERLRSEPYTCRLVTLSEIIRQHRLEVVDLIKIDVQKSELDVLRGVADEDWPRIRQIVIEVHDHQGRADQVAHLLTARGFAVRVEQDEHYLGSEMYNLYAARQDHIVSSPSFISSSEPSASAESGSSAPRGNLPPAQPSRAVARPARGKSRAALEDRADRQKRAWHLATGRRTPGKKADD